MRNRDASTLRLSDDPSGESGPVPAQVTAADRLVDVWLEPPHNRVAFQRVDTFLPTAPIGRGTGPKREFEASPTEIDSITFDDGTGSSTIADFLESSFTDGFLVLRGDRILVERYYNGMTPATRHILMSVSKPLAGLTAGAAVDAGLLDVRNRVGDLVPELGSSGYADATVQHVLDMAVRLVFDQNYDDPGSELQREDRAAGWRSSLPGDPPGSQAFISGLAKAGPHGERFQYCSPTTDVLAWILERQTGISYPDLVSRSLWSRIGAGHDAFVTVDSTGFPYACAGVNATLSDVARLGRLILDGGAWGGQRVVSRGWIAEAINGAGALVSTAVEPDEVGVIYPHAVYHNHLWTTRDPRGTAFGIGIFGQFLWLDPTSDVVIVKFSSWPAAFDQRMVGDHLRAVGALAEALS